MYLWPVHVITPTEFLPGGQRSRFVDVPVLRDFFVFYLIFFNFIWPSGARNTLCVSHVTSIAARLRIAHLSGKSIDRNGGLSCFWWLFARPLSPFWRSKDIIKSGDPKVDVQPSKKRSLSCFSGLQVAPFGAVLGLDNECNVEPKR